MIGYRSLFISTVLLLPLGTVAAESADVSKQDTTSDAIHQHHESVTGDKAQSESPPKKEGGHPMEGMEHHHMKGMDRGEHHMEGMEGHDMDMGSKSQSKSSSGKEGEYPRHKMHKGGHPTEGMDMGEHQMEGMEGHIHPGEHHIMDMDMGGMVMHENKDELPRGCPELAGDVHITVRAGTKYAEKYPGTVFGYDKHEWHVKPCTRLTVTFINEDEVRHQWMVHMLPEYLYPKGMFHIEVNGPGRRTGTLILPSVDKTYFVHCDISQHMEKGMKAQLVVGEGDVNFPSIPGITAPKYPDTYTFETSWTAIGSSVGAGIIGFVLAMMGLGRVKRMAEAKKSNQAQAAAPVPEAKQKKSWWFGRK